MLKIIDPHLHLFDIDKGDYHWLKAENPPCWPDKEHICRNFNERDLELNGNSNLAGYVHIEAGFDNVQWWREVEWLESIAALPFRSVASADLTKTASKFKFYIKKLHSYQSVVGVRHIFDDQANELLSNKNVIGNLAQLDDHGLSFDLQMLLTDTSAVSKLITNMKQFPTLSIIINHAGFPPQVSEHDWNTWKKNLLALGQFSNIAVKCSGWEMGNRSYDQKWLKSVISECLSAFGEHRVMLASNFPLCLFSKPYKEFWQQYTDVTTRQKKALLHDNAVTWYKF